MLFSVVGRCGAKNTVYGDYCQSNALQVKRAIQRILSKGFSDKTNLDQQT